MPVIPTGLAPRHNKTIVHEPAKVERGIHARVDLVMARFGLTEELALPVHGVASDEAGEQVVVPSMSQMPARGLER